MSTTINTDMKADTKMKKNINLVTQIEGEVEKMCSGSDCKSKSKQTVKKSITKNSKALAIIKDK